MNFWLVTGALYLEKKKQKLREQLVWEFYHIAAAEPYAKMKNFSQSDSKEGEKVEWPHTKSLLSVTCLEIKTWGNH